MTLKSFPNYLIKCNSLCDKNRLENTSILEMLSHRLSYIEDGKKKMKKKLQEKADNSITLKVMINLHSCKANQEPKIRTLNKLVLTQASKHLKEQ